MIKAFTVNGIFPNIIGQLKRSVAGATAVEYGLLAGLIALGIAGGVGTLADLVIAIFTMLGNSTDEVAATINN